MIKKYFVSLITEHLFINLFFFTFYLFFAKFTLNGFSIIFFESFYGSEVNVGLFTLKNGLIFKDAYS